MLAKLLALFTLFGVIGTSPLHIYGNGACIRRICSAGSPDFHRLCRQNDDGHILKYSQARNAESLFDWVGDTITGLISSLTESVGAVNRWRLFLFGGCSKSYKVGSIVAGGILKFFVFF